ncbi:methyl-accepting chemotaxis protein [Polycladidibacter hongkongensis]|uniref:methyl-accepting chemotaxis protein n=1 Tax=Polycladidibacter hongkongensis TaxID=1647556 RepID=UPI000ABCE262|nr:HAMP domain-containing methyl-accepting chemotaxis protein [Pseudovibrio hongkongensis]
MIQLSIIGRFVFIVALAITIMGAGTLFSFYIIYETLTSAMADGAFRQSLLSSGGEGALIELLQDKLIFISVVCAPVGVLFLAIAFFIGLRTKTALGSLQTGLDGLAAGELDTEIAGIKRRDEIGHIARSIGQFRVVLRQKAEAEIAAQMEKDIEFAEARKQALEDVALSFKQSVGGVVEQLYQISESVEARSMKLARSVNDAASAMNSSTDAAVEAQQSVQMVVETAQEVARSTNSISSDADQANTIAQQAVLEAEKTDEIVGRLAESGRAIGEVVELIDQIADQTNLLALNATIEAARAGEAGRGFAIVANEVKDLAGQTSKATEEISQQVQAVQDVAEQTVQAIRSIRGTIDQINELAGNIDRAVSDQRFATDGISDSLESAHSSAQRVAADIEQMQRDYKATQETSGHMHETSEQLGRLSGSLRGEVEKFLGTVQSA